MSAYGHEMEREYSASLSRDEESDMGSEFRMESVIYMSSFAATIIVGSLVTIRILLMTLLIALIVMLQSCKSRNSELDINNFESYYLPEICKDLAIKYIKDGHYIRDLRTMESLVENYFKNVTPVVGGQDVVLMDIDDLLVDGLRRYGHDEGVKEAKHMKHVFLVQLCTKLQSGGWLLVLMSREHENQRCVVVDKLIAARCGGWSELIMRSDEEMKMETCEYFSKQMTVMQAKGYHIRDSISSRMDILVGLFMRTQTFKLPNLFIT